MGTPAHLWTVGISGVFVVTIWLFAFACRTTVFDAHVVRILAFTANSGVTDMVAVFALSASNTFDLTVRNGRIVEVMVVVLLLLSLPPMLSFHQSYNAPGRLAGKVPRPDASL